MLNRHAERQCKTRSIIKRVSINMCYSLDTSGVASLRQRLWHASNKMNRQNGVNEGANGGASPLTRLAKSPAFPYFANPVHHTVFLFRYFQFEVGSFFLVAADISPYISPSYRHTKLSNSSSFCCSIPQVQTTSLSSTSHFTYIGVL